MNLILKTENLMMKIFNVIYKINNHYFFIVLSLTGLLPLLILSFFNNPSSDDFDLSYESQTEPFWALISRRYFFWSGRYLSNILFCLNPLVINNYFLFKLIPIVLILFFIFSIYLFLSSLELNISRLEKYSYVGLIFFLYVYQMPSVSEGFYWVTALYVYLVSQILILLFFSMLFHYFQSKKKVYFFLSSLFLFAVMGTNEIAVVSLLFIMFILFSYNLVILKNINISLFFILILTVCFAFLEVFAPGNFERANYICVKYQLLNSIIKSFQISISLIMKWIPIITICCLFFISNIVKILNDRVNRKYITHPFLSFLFFFLLVYLAVFTCFWITNGAPPERASNTVYFFFILAYLYFLFTIIHYFVILKKYDLYYSKNMKFCLGIFILLIFFSNNNITLAYNDLITGKAYKYNNEMKARFELINNCKKSECVLPGLINTPLSIYSRNVMGLTNDKQNWKNLEIARYFRKKSILIQPADSLITE